MLDKIIKEINNSKIIILMHQNADGDAIGSAIALKLAYPKMEIGVFSGVSKIAKKILNELECEIIEKPKLDEYEKIIALDTSSPSQLETDVSSMNYIVIDHHTKSDFWDEPTYYYCDESKSSCAEIIYDILKLSDKEITSRIGLALVCGILTDTSHFRYSNPKTFSTVSKILKESKINIQDVLKIIEENNYDKSKKIAHMKATQRLKYDVVNDIIIAYTKISSFEGSASKALLSIGADISFVGSQHENEVRISARLKKPLTEIIHLGKFMIEIGEENNGEGGGHPGAGGLNCIGDVDDLLKICIIKIKEKIKHNT